MIGVGLLGELAFELKPEGVLARAVISFSFLFFPLPTAAPLAYGSFRAQD